MSGTTTKVANVIKEETGGDIFNVNCLVDYTGISGFLKAGYHQVAGIIPDIKDVPNIDGYDLIYVGGPVYWFEGPILKLLKKVDFKNKNVIPLLTCGGYYGSYFEKFAASARNATIVGQGPFKGAQRLK